MNVSNAEIAEVLIAARGRIAGGWCKNVYARDADGYACDSTSVFAKCFCAIGAVEASIRLNSASRAFHARQSVKAALCLTLGYEQTTDAAFITAWNDEPGRTKEEVVGLFDDTIARLSGSL